MVNGNCAVISCTNSRYKLKVWEKKNCDEHAGEIHKDCPCPPPFRLHIFPSVLHNMDKRKEWIRQIRRTAKGNKEWSPGQSDMVCSCHFVDGRPTLENPNPTIELGYEKPANKARRVLIRSEPKQKEPRHEKVETVEPTGPPVTPRDECETCLQKQACIGSLQERLDTLSKEKASLEETVNQLSARLESLDVKKTFKRPMTSKLITSDAKMRFYTGIHKIVIFNVLLGVLKPLVPKLVFWRGSRTIISTKAKRGGYDGVKTHKLSIKEQFLLVLMRLRLGLLNEDLADRFKVSPACASRIFTTWVKFLGKVLGDALISWLPKTTIQTNLPHVFSGVHHRTRCIIDCTEVYVERPKSLDIQAGTWSDYKKHNTIKFLIGIAPSGFVTFLSDSYGGRTTDQYICQNSGFYKLLDYGDEVMADRGFQIREDLLYYNCTLHVPPGARVKAQMTKEECRKTKEIANVRIHVERAINRVKTFRILKSTLPLTLLPLADDIVRVCAALCNVLPPLIKPAKKDS